MSADDTNSDNISSMRKEIYEFLDDLKNAIKIEIPLKKYDKVVVCGMGASAIGGELVSNAVADYSPIMVTSPVYATIPYWVDKSVLAVICSYSGNTAETLSMYNQAIEKGMDILVVTSGGKLEELATNHNDIVVKIKPGVQPRNALGWFIGILSTIIENIDGPKLRTDLIESMEELETFRKDLYGDESIAYQIADNLEKRTPVVYATPSLVSAALRWKTQMNENSKRIAFSGMIPEFNHNEIAGWYSDGFNDRYQQIILYGIDDKDMFLKTLKATVTVLSEVDVNPIIVKIWGKSAITRSVKAVMIGDLASLRLAEIHGVNPFDVLPITKLKKLLSDDGL